jgi:hypothetical protein
MLSLLFVFGVFDTKGKNVVKAGYFITQKRKVKNDLSYLISYFSIYLLYNYVFLYCVHTQRELAAW